MAENFYTILTDVGKAKIANSQVTGEKVDLTQMAVGDGSGAYYNPVETQTALKNEVWRGNIGSIEVDSANTNWIVIETVIPADTGGSNVREAGIFDVDGDMIAIGKYPDTYKPVLSEGSAKDLYIRMIIEVTNASAVTLKIDPAVTIASRKYVDEQVAIVDQKAGQNTTDIQSLESNVNSRQIDNIGYGVQTGLEVTASTTPDMNVHAQSGVIYMPNGNRFEFSAVKTFAVTAADATNPRKDIIYVSSTGVIEYLAGIPATIPAKPALPSGALELREIDVPAGDTAIEDAQLIDTRIMKKVVAYDKDLQTLEETVTSHKAEKATDSTLGHVMIGEGITVDSEGRIFSSIDTSSLEEKDRELTREIANLKLYQNAIQRVENGNVFGDAFTGDVMGTTFLTAESDYTLKNNKVYVNNVKRTVFENGNQYIPLIQGYQSAYSKSSITNYGTSFDVYAERDMGQDGSAEITLTTAEPMTLSDVSAICFDASVDHEHSGNTNYVYFAFSELQEGSVFNGAYKAVSTNLTTARTIFTVDVTSLTFTEGYPKIMARGVGYNSHTHCHVYGIYALDVNGNRFPLPFELNPSFLTYQLPETNEVVAWVKKEGDLGVTAFLDGQVMDMELVGDEYQFTKTLPAISAPKLKLDYTIGNSTPTLTDLNNSAITRILGGVAK